MAYMPALSYEAIADGLTVCTSSLHRFGTDAVLLTEFSGYRQKDRVCDFGTGCGIIPMRRDGWVWSPAIRRTRHIRLALKAS